MKKLETELNEIFQEYKGKYISEFDQSEGVNAKLNNQLKFTPLSFELKNKLLEKANQYKNSIYKEEMVNRFVLNFRDLFHNPFAR